jgi:hypothetical protein
MECFDRNPREIMERERIHGQKKWVLPGFSKSLQNIWLTKSIHKALFGMHFA